MKTAGPQKSRDAGEAPGVLQMHLRTDIYNHIYIYRYRYDIYDISYIYMIYIYMIYIYIYMIYIYMIYIYIYDIYMIYICIIILYIYIYIYHIHIMTIGPAQNSANMRRAVFLFDRS